MIPDVSGIIATTKYEGRSGALTPSGVAERRWRSHSMGTVYIPLSSRKRPGLSSLINEVDYDLVAGRIWYPYVNKGTGVYARTGKRGLGMHRLILGVEDPSLLVDHINRNGLDNRRENLRIVTLEQNAQNKGLRRANSSGFIGVYQRHSGRWSASFCWRGKQISIGAFDTAIEAAIAYDAVIVEHRGEFAVTNASLGLVPVTGWQK